MINEEIKRTRRMLESKVLTSEARLKTDKLNLLNFDKPIIKRILDGETQTKSNLIFRVIESESIPKVSYMKMSKLICAENEIDFEAEKLLFLGESKTSVKLVLDLIQ